MCDEEKEEDEEKIEEEVEKGKEKTDKEKDDTSEWKFLALFGAPAASNSSWNVFSKIYKEISVRFADEDPEKIGHFCFNGHPSAYIPVATGKASSLACFWGCVWKGPLCLRKKHLLAIHDEYSSDPHMAYLFKEKFTEGNLVYLPAERAWLAPASCVWVDAQRIGAQYGISTVYPELEDFFRITLKVQVPTTATYIEHLRRLDSHDPENIAEIKITIHKTAARSPRPNDLEGLHGIGFLPIEVPNGSVTLLQPMDTFFIADRIEYRSTFQGRAPILDFSLEDIRRLDRLLKSLSLGDRYISRTVQEKTMVEQPSSEPSLSETRAFRRKAKHIYRCALHYHTVSLKPQSSPKLRQLRSAVVFESCGFKKVSTLELNEIAASVQSGTGLVHIDDTLLLPRASNALIRFFGLRDPAPFLTLQLVFASSEDMFDHVLDVNGIIRFFDGPQGSKPALSDISDSEGGAETYPLSDRWPPRGFIYTTIKPSNYGGDILYL
ncbi:hypothetical protein ETB97_000451 [Aspergillus alliaceus]|uniref:Uncharacterized protein n=1 Tax=Petromyces alliaceus TaxID=209559 RepID=A0A8H6A6V7_PETAA|nr:hypothetical protein ETB97_000451 [Aspergillus burnettii]